MIDKPVHLICEKQYGKKHNVNPAALSYIVKNFTKNGVLILNTDKNKQEVAYEVKHSK